MTAQRILLCAAAPSVRRWVEEELAGIAVDVRIVGTVGDALSVLSASSDCPWLVVAFEHLTRPELDALQAVRRRSVAGFIALGRVRPWIRSSLQITHEIVQPFGSEALRAIIDDQAGRTDTIGLRKFDA